jgi:hypothetical protein
MNKKQKLKFIVYFSVPCICLLAIIAEIIMDKMGMNPQEYSGVVQGSYILAFSWLFIGLPFVVEGDKNE